MTGRVPGLGWKMNEDPRKADHPLKARLATPAPLRNISWAMFTHPLNQGMTSCCVGFATKHWELIAPVIRTRVLGPPTGVDFYLAATKRDPWHNGQPDTTLQDGTSITAMMLALRDEFHLIEGFDWTDKVDDILQFLCSPTGGPVVLGLPWLNSMFTTPPDGILKVDTTSGWAGGHAIAASLLSISRPGEGTDPIIGGPNSWGRPADFGKLDPKTGMRDGRWRMHVEDLRTLLREGGDACAARELRR